MVTADDPGMYTSQNEQDNRHYAKFAKIPHAGAGRQPGMQGLHLAAVEISERFDTPVVVRTTMRIAHSKSVVDWGPP